MGPHSDRPRASLTPLTLALLASALALAPARASEPVMGPDSSLVPAPRDTLRRPGDPAGEWLFSYFAAPRRDTLADVRADLARFYAARGWSRPWSAGDWPLPRASRLVEALRHASGHGLDPDQFDAGTLAARLARMRPPWAPPTAADIARLDLLLSASAMRYGAALAGGRVPVRIAHPTLRDHSPRLDRVALLDTLAAIDDPGPVLESLAPHGLEYRRLRALLLDYRTLEGDSALTRLERRRHPLRLWERTPDAHALRRLLWRAGAMSDSVAAVRHRDSMITREIVAAARVIARRDSVPFDGTLGPALAPALRQELVRREHAVVLALERQRWLTRDLPAPPIVVNIPAFEMRYWRGTTDDSGTVMRMRVCVGGADSTQTPVLSDRIDAIVFRPNWNIPRSIMRNEIKPKALADSAYLDRNHYELVDKKTGRVVPQTPENLDAIGLTVRVRQKSGEGNALGDMKFVLSNSEAIYMHDTPMRAPFRRARRDVSHGCIRLQDAHALARYLLRDRPDWPPARIEHAARIDTAQKVVLTAPIPVEIVYWTATARPTGGLDVYPDIYKCDDTLDSLLHLRYPLPR